MNVTRRTPVATATLVALALAAPVLAPSAQQPARTPEAGLKVTRLEAQPAAPTLEAGKTVPFRIVARDANGQVVSDAIVRMGAARRGLRLTDSTITATSAGSFEVMAQVLVPPGGSARPVTLTVPVKVTWPALATVAVSSEPGALYAGSTLQHTAAAKHADDSERPDVAITWTSSDPSVATVDRYGLVNALKPGAVTITASAEGVKGEKRYAVQPFPVTSLDVTVSANAVRTGDVVKLQASARNRAGQPVSDVPITWSYTYTPDDSIAAPGATGAIVDGQFVGEFAGRYTVIANAGPLSARRVVDVRPREVMQRVQVMGRGQITHVHTSDLWTFTGKDGRDYALVGTWGGDGWSYMFDITNPASIVKTDSVKIDARIVNDVTVSPDGRWGVLSREGASNRVNGVVVLDLADPAHPKVTASFSEDLTGGVHNMFATNTHLFAISGGAKYVIIDMADLTKPRRVGQYDHPDSYVHDVWVNDGIAYSSEWGTGVVAVDVGNGKYGGSLEKPVLIGTYATTSGATHEIYPYHQKSSGKTYLFLGDEVMSRRGRAWEGVPYSLTEKGGVPQTLAGYTHIVDFTDPKNPKNIARYEQPEFGSHDIIVEGDVLYQAYYDGGLRVVDVSGDLIGNLARQSREIAVFKPYDPQGYTANAPMVMNAMPHKGVVFFTDFNSGLWAAKLQPRTPPVP
jgi:hypothetical protein